MQRENQKQSRRERERDQKMRIKLIALVLIATSISVINGMQRVLAKEGRREVVVEYDDTAGGTNTRVSVSPSETNPAVGPIEHQLSRAAASVAGVAQDVKGKAEDVIFNSNGPSAAGPRELICDSFGKCKHRIALALSKAKEKAVSAEEEAMEKIKDLTSKVVEKSTEGVRENAKEKAAEAGEAIKDKVKEKTKEVVKGTTEKMIEEGKKVILNTIRYFFWPKSVGSLMGMIQILGFAMAYGVSLWVTFIMSRVLSGLLPRQQFGMVQSKIYPLYFKAIVGSIGLALLGHLGTQRFKLFIAKAEMLQAFNLMGSLLLVLANLNFLEPQASKVMFERMKMEKEEGRGGGDVRGSATTEVVDTTVPTTTAETITTTTQNQPQTETESKMANLDNRLKQLNSYSSLLNTATLMALTWHLTYLGDRLAVSSC